jgi:hypothetical protein
VFTTPGEAGDHFGATLSDKPGCLIDYRVQVEAGTTTQRGRGLLMALRKAEAELARYREEDTDLHRALYAKDSERDTAVRRAEEEGYARGLRDGMPDPLSEARISELFCNYDECKTYRDGINFARAIEREHGVGVALPDGGQR